MTTSLAAHQSVRSAGQQLSGVAGACTGACSVRPWTQVGASLFSFASGFEFRVELGGAGFHWRAGRPIMLLATSQSGKGPSQLNSGGATEIWKDRCTVNCENDLPSCLPAGLLSYFYSHLRDYFLYFVFKLISTTLSHLFPYSLPSTRFPSWFFKLAASQMTRIPSLMNSI